MSEKWKRALDKGEYFSALFMDLSKTFDKINHDLLIAKLKVYGFSEEALKFMKSCLKNWKQKVQINNKFSSERDVITGVPQGSIDGPLLFNLFINNLVFFIEQCTLSNYADDNNLSISREDKELIKPMLSSDFMIVENWFFENYMTLNPGKCYFMCIGKNALLKISSHINTDKKSLLYKSMIKSQFAYCPLVWMFCFRQSNNLINKVHERALKLIYQDNCNFEVLLEKQHDFSIHERNLQVLMTEVSKIVNGIAPPIMNSLFTLKFSGAVDIKKRHC